MKNTIFAMILAATVGLANAQTTPPTSGFGSNSNGQGNGTQGQGNGTGNGAGNTQGNGQGTALTKEEIEQRKQAAAAEQKWREEFIKSEKNGIEVRIKDIARFRGIRSNQLMGYGLIVGLEGTGDTKSTAMTATLLANAMKSWGTQVDPNALKVRNVALVAITADLPPFATPGNTIDVTVQSIGDAKSLQGGTLLQAPLYAANSKDTVYAVAQGPISIGGFNVGSGGNSVQKNHTTVGRLISGAIIETAAPTKFVFDGKLFLELDDQDVTTAQRIADKVSKTLPGYAAKPLNGGTVEVTLPAGKSPIEAMSELELTTVFADVPATVVINERTGTITLGGNIKIGAAVVIKGSLNIRIVKDPVISQPNPLSLGQTVVTEQTTVTAEEDTAQVAIMGPTTTVFDIAKLFQALKVTPRDAIAILQDLQTQGALKARIKVN